MDQEALDYLKANQDTYTREALAARLREAGYTDAEIEAGREQIHDQEGTPEQPAPPGPAVAPQPPYTPSPYRGEEFGCGFFFGIMLLVGLGAGLVGLTNMVLFGPLLWFVNLGSLVILVALWAGGWWLVRRKGVRVADVGCLVVVVAFVWYVIVVGTCLNGNSLFSY